MPTPIEWADEPQRMSNIRDGVGCPHGRLNYCYVCEQLEIEAEREMNLGLNPWEMDSSEIGEGGEFVE